LTAAGFKGAAIRGFHDAWATAGDDGETLRGKQCGSFLCGFVSGSSGCVRAEPKIAMPRLRWPVHRSLRQTHP
jgi:hypothetical protein